MIVEEHRQGLKRKFRSSRFRGKILVRYFYSSLARNLMGVLILVMAP